MTETRPLALAGIEGLSLRAPIAAGTSEANARPLALARPVTLDWPGVTAVLDGGALSLGPASGPALTKAADVTARPGGDLGRRLYSPYRRSRRRGLTTGARRTPRRSAAPAP